MQVLNRSHPYALECVFIALLLALSGCSRAHYLVELPTNDDVGIDTVVKLDGHPVGRVEALSRNGDVRRADIVITDRSFRQGLPRGVAREPGSGINLSTSAVGTATELLPFGATIATRAPVAQATHRFAVNASEAWWKFVDCWKSSLILKVTAAALVLFAAWGLWKGKSGRVLVVAIVVLAASGAGSHLGAAVKPAELEVLLKDANGYLASAEREAADARRFVATGLNRDAQECGVRVLFLCDRLRPLEASIRDNIPHLGAFTGIDTIDGLKTRVRRLGDRRAELENQIVAIGAAATPAQRLVRLYVKQRERIQAQCVRDGTYDIAAVIARLTDLAAYPVTLVDEAMLVHWDNVKLCRLDAGRVVLPDDAANAVAQGRPDDERVRRKQLEKDVQLLHSGFEAQPVHVWPVSLGSGASHRPAAKAETIVADQPKSPEAAATAAPIVAKVAPPIPPVTPRVAPTPEHVVAPSVQSSAFDRRIVVGGVVALAVILVAVGAVRLLRTPSDVVTVTLRAADGAPEQFDVRSDEQLILDRVPYVGLGLDEAPPLPAIVLSGEGATLRAGASGHVEVGGQTPAADHRLVAGERIKVVSDRHTVEFEYLGAAGVL